jgi:hypothetical protein
MCPDTLIPATGQAASPALHDQRALYRMCDTVFARLDKVGLDSHRCNGNFGAVCEEQPCKDMGERQRPVIGFRLPRFELRTGRIGEHLADGESKGGIDLDYGESSFPVPPVGLGNSRL